MARVSCSTARKSGGPRATSRANWEPTSRWPSARGSSTTSARRSTASRRAPTSSSAGRFSRSTARRSPPSTASTATTGTLLLNAADAISPARPGARREILETYVRRLEKLEKMTEGMKGVERTFAIQAGRELRVIVDAKKVTDDECLWMSKDLAKRIEAELQYPGQIKITVIRETRAVDFAK